MSEETGQIRKPNYVPNVANAGPEGPPPKRTLYISLACSLLGKVIAVTMIVVGANNKDNCNIEPMIPKFLIGEQAGI